MSESRRRSAGGLALALVVVILSIGAAAAAPSQGLREPQQLVPDPPRLFEVEFSPLEGPRGTVIVAEGRCMWDADRGVPASRVLVSSVPRAISIDDIEHQHYASQDRLRADGAFQVELTVPHEVPPGEYLLSASCSSEDQVFAFTDVIFTVTTGQPIPTSTTTTTTTTVTAPSTTVLPPGPPEPVTLEPTFTG